MNKEKFKEVLKKCQEYGEKYQDCNDPEDVLYDVLTDLDIYQKGIYEKVKEEILDSDRWSNTTIAVFRLEGNHFLEFCWQAPATENQEGACTMMEAYEVVPLEVTKIIYVKPAADKGDEFDEYSINR